MLPTPLTTRTPPAQAAAAVAALRDAPSINAAIKALRPIVESEARKMARILPASVTMDEVTAAGLVGAWQAARDFDGRGDREAFARQRIKQRMLDYLRTSHPAGRSGLKIVATGGDEEAQDVAAPDDVLATVTARQELDALSGAEKREAAKHLPPAKRKTSPNFDPKAVKLHKGQPVPAPQRKRVNKYRQMLERMTATDHCELDPVVANSLVSEMKKAKVRHCFRTLDNGLVGVWREPSAEQLKGIRKCQ